MKGDKTNKPATRNILFKIAHKNISNGDSKGDRQQKQRQRQEAETKRHKGDR